MATLKENGLAISYEFKEGNDNGGKQAAVKKAFEKMPVGKEIDETLLDAEYYEAEVLDYVDAKCKRWSVREDKDSAVKTTIEAIPEESWKPFKNHRGDTTDRRSPKRSMPCSMGKSFSGSSCSGGRSVRETSSRTRGAIMPSQPECMTCGVRKK